MSVKHTEAPGAADVSPIVRLEGVTRRFGSHTAVADISLTLEQGTCTVLLGPSGAGKTTLLRLLGGFDRPDSGRIFIGGRDVTQSPPHRRDIGFVFQQQALFPHLDVAGNVGFALRQRGVHKSERRARVARMLEVVGLAGLESRAVADLSGGQAQRVAIARALVFHPSLLVLDEPLTGLDRHLRDSLQAEIRVLQRRLRMTTLYVTHDQTEAFLIADRIAVINGGRLDQCGLPMDVYRTPANRFVAQFVGRSNIVEATVLSGGGGRLLVRLSNGDEVQASGTALPGERVELHVRPENLRLATRSTVDDGINVQRAEVIDAVGLGPTIEVQVRFADVAWRMQLLAGDISPLPRPGEMLDLAFRATDFRQLG
jgi:ABC-type Fe3+/spermidine/putrescine transport system ATPase subunit